MFLFDQRLTVDLELCAQKASEIIEEPVLRREEEGEPERRA